MTRKWYATLRHPKMHPHTKFGIPTSKNVGDMNRTRSGTDERTHGRTDGWTVRLLYASQSSFGGIKILVYYFFMRNPYMKFQNCILINFVTDARTDGKAQSNMPLQLFQSWGRKNMHWRQFYWGTSDFFQIRQACP